MDLRLWWMVCALAASLAFSPDAALAQGSDCNGNCTGVVEDDLGEVVPDRRAFTKAGACDLSSSACFPTDSSNCAICSPGCLQVIIVVPAGFQWEARRSADWIEFCGGGDPDVRTGTAPASGQVSICYRVLENPGNQARNGNICFNFRGSNSNEQAAHCICQKGGGCPIALPSVCESQFRTYLPACSGTSITSDLISDLLLTNGPTCPWTGEFTAQAGSAWLGQAGGGGSCQLGPWSGTGSSVIPLCWSENSGASARLGTLEVRNQFQTGDPGASRQFVQSASGCSIVEVDPPLVTFQSGGGLGAITITTSGSDCVWFARVRGGGGVGIQFTDACDQTAVFQTTIASGIGTTRTINFEVLGSASGGIGSIEISNGCGDVVEVPIVQSDCQIESFEAGWLERVQPDPTVPPEFVFNPLKTIPAAGSDAFPWINDQPPLRVRVQWPAGSSPFCGYWAEVPVASASFIEIVSGSWGFPSPPADPADPLIAVELVLRIDPNDTGAPRQGVVLISGLPLTIDQEACGNPALTPTSIQIASSGGASLVGVSTDATFCGWQAETADSWIQLDPSTAEGFGAASSIRFDVAPNQTGLARTGEIRIGSATCTVTQSGDDCPAPVVLPLVPSVVGACGTLGVDLVLEVSTDEVACGWTATSTVPWIDITSGGSGTGPSGQVTFAVESNGAFVERRGFVLVDGVPHEVVQPAAPCAITAFDPPSANLPAEGVWCAIDETGPPCPTVGITTESGGWWLESSAWWLEIVSGWLGPGFGPIQYRVYPNPSNEPRTATIHQVGQPDGVVFTVVQEGATLPALMASVSPGTTIRLEPGIYQGPIDYLGRELVIESIDGPMVTIIESAAELGPVVKMEFEAEAGKGERPRPVLRGVTVRSELAPAGPGQSSLLGGGVKVVNADAVFEQCIFTSLKAASGGAIGVEGGSILVDDCSFFANEAVESGGAIFARDAAVFLSGGVIAGGSAGVAGGGVAIGGVDPDGRPSSMFGVALLQNSASIGGGLWVASQSMPPSIAGAYWCGNEPEAISGAWIDAGGNASCLCLGDVTQDGQVDGADLAGVLAAWGECVESGCIEDLDLDGQVGGADLAILLSAWGGCVP